MKCCIAELQSNLASELVLADKLGKTDSQPKNATPKAQSESRTGFKDFAAMTYLTSLDIFAGA